MDEQIINLAKYLIELRKKGKADSCFLCKGGCYNFYNRDGFYHFRDTSLHGQISPILKKINIIWLKLKLLLKDRVDAQIPYYDDNKCVFINQPYELVINTANKTITEEK